MKRQHRLPRARPAERRKLDNTMTTVFYELPANELQEGVSTDDGQDVLHVEVCATGVLASVYTARSDDPDIDEDNRNFTETRLYDVAEMVPLAVFPDTDTDLSGHPKARNRRTRADA